MKARVVMKYVPPIPIDSLYHCADFVGIVEITSGTLIGKSASYHANVVRRSKGDWPASEIEFGSYKGYAIGTSYLVFLKRDSTNQYVIMEKSRELMPLAIGVHKRNTLLEEIIRVWPRDIYVPHSITKYQYYRDTVVTRDFIFESNYVPREELIRYLEELPLRENDPSNRLLGRHLIWGH